MELPITISGTVMRGKGLGRKVLGTPTANLASYERLPELWHGVYLSRTRIGNEERLWPGLAFVGKSEIMGDLVVSVENHLLDFSGDICGKEITLTLIDRMRDVIRFEKTEDLRAQIMEDIRMARDYFRKNVVA